MENIDHAGMLLIGFQSASHCDSQNNYSKFICGKSHVKRRVHQRMPDRMQFFIVAGIILALIPRNCMEDIVLI